MTYTKVRADLRTHVTHGTRYPIISVLGGVNLQPQCGSERFPALWPFTLKLDVSAKVVFLYSSGKMTIVIVSLHHTITNGPANDIA
mgnify:CR=1 FL=1